jgi:hypothetical protein
LPACGQVFEKSEKLKETRLLKKQKPKKQRPQKWMQKSQSVVNRPDVLVRIPLSILDLKEQKASGGAVPEVQPRL